MDKKMKKALFKIDEFCSKNKIQYMVTGTVALNILGIFPDYTPHDLDIKVFNLKEEQKSELKDYQSLSSEENEDYKDSDNCYSFKINDINVNFLNYKKDITYEEIKRMCIYYINVADTDLNKRYLIPIQKVNFALKDKIKLQRDKDRVYILNLIANLTKICDLQK